MSSSRTLEEREKNYETSRGVIAQKCLGVGTQGTAQMYDNPSRSAPIAVKFHERQVAYQRELSVYHRLTELEVDQVAGHRVPLLVGFDDELLAIEMTIVSPPFCLDFGGAYLDRPPDYSDQTWADWEAEKSEAFEERWPDVEEILTDFRLMGIYIAM